MNIRAPVLCFIQGTLVVILLLFASNRMNGSRAAVFGELLYYAASVQQLVIKHNN